MTFRRTYWNRNQRFRPARKKPSKRKGLLTKSKSRWQNRSPRARRRQDNRPVSFTTQLTSFSITTSRCLLRMRRTTTALQKLHLSKKITKATSTSSLQKSDASPSGLSRVCSARTFWSHYGTESIPQRYNIRRYPRILWRCRRRETWQKGYLTVR